MANGKKYRDGVLKAIPQHAEVMELLLSDKPFHGSLCQLSQFLHSSGSAPKQGEVDFSFLTQQIDFIIVRTLQIPNRVFKTLAASQTVL